MNNRRKTLPPIDPKIDPKLRAVLEALKEIQETGEGVRGDPMDRKLTIRDLVDAGLARLRPGSMTEFGPVNDDPIDNDPPGSTLIPPRPTGFNAIGSFGYIVLSWDIPGDLYLNHAFTNIYRSETDNFANAKVIGRDTGMMYTDHIREVEEEGVGFYYWITFTSTEDREGPPNNTSGTYAEVIPDLGFLLDRLSGEIDESVLAKSLNGRIDKIEVLETGIKTETEIRESADLAMARRIDNVSAAANGNASAIQTEQTVRADADAALAQQITTVQSQLGGNIASVEQSMTTNIERLNGELVKLGAEYTLKLDVNGYVSGFGAYNDGKTSDFAIAADRFWVAPPNSTGKRKPFIIQNNKVYIDTAMIRNASIQEGQLGPISFGKITDRNGSPVTTVAGKLKGELIEADNLRVAEAATFYGDVYSNNYWSGVSGWAIRQNGSAEFNNVTVRGTLYAEDIEGDVNDVAQVNWQGDKRVSSYKSLIHQQSIYISYSNKQGKCPYFMLTLRCFEERSDSTIGVTVQIEQNGRVLAEQYTAAQFGGNGGVAIAGGADNRIKGTVVFKVFADAYFANTMHVYQVSGLIGALA
ncbi:phage tail tip fiber protein [Vreelandella aquamarina]|uniref:Tip attachment protein J central straight fiber domain-containing protein n=1 Tax=Vreelandella aquamarina TaxID=77097 RepID=A0A6F8STZ0_9GAMM|nr:DUF1983 domain-containing protein [Halomonas meridiana]BCA91884.1 hypothetical protein HMSLTHF_16590 [Halomonas meridiana]